jgi:hypothetical protein
LVLLVQVLVAKLRSYINSECVPLDNDHSKTVFRYDWNNNFHKLFFKFALKFAVTMGRVAVIGGTSSESPSVLYLEQSLCEVLTFIIIIDVGREAIDAIVERGNYEVKTMSQNVNLYT